MSYVPFYEFFPEVAERETRCVTVLAKGYEGVPAGKYVFIEMFCDEKGCDCRRVFLCVISPPSNQVQAVIAYGWESPAFYAQWMGDDDPQIIEWLQGPCLNPGSPRSAVAPAILKLFQETLLPDAAYVDRIKRHYRMFRDKVDGAERRRGRRRHNKRKRRR